MTVAELIAKLEQCDPKLYVVTADDFEGIHLSPPYLLRRKDVEFSDIFVRQ